MTIEAKLENSVQGHRVVVSTNGVEKDLGIAPKREGRGSSINGGEVLMTAIATCFCNDIFREAVRQNIENRSIYVDVTSQFGGEGEPAKSISYSAKIDSPAPLEEVQKLITDVDHIAEIHNTLRQGIQIKLRDHTSN